MSSNTIIRAARNSENPYAQIARSLFEDERLSWRAKGLMGYLLSRKDGWKVYVADLQKRSTDGRDACYKALAELGSTGYLERFEVREKGRVKGYEYVIHEVANDDRAASWKTVSGKAVSGETGNGNTVSGKTDTSNNLLKGITEEPIPEAGGAGRDSATPLQIPDGTPAAAELQNQPQIGASAGAAVAATASQGTDSQKSGPTSQDAPQTNATSTEQVSGGPAAAIALLNRMLAGKRVDGPDGLIAENPAREAWLTLDPALIAAIKTKAFNEHGSRKFLTPMIRALDEAVRPKTKPSEAPADHRAQIMANLRASRSPS
ncbi:hypothetical protein [Deinococcus ruber]|uniref:Uncharacterized protein n=1 Tax=Deinococcus ruber TaxID=1848197 RepID=A0A918F8W5_9DEIO|nr:hypothetical protein [Deinococcus ruber]GGR11566.1 hypothetical protein GCM10008957_25660 [Deinococcus ruber]